MLSHMRMGVPYEYTHMGCPIRVWANIRIWGRTFISEDTALLHFCRKETVTSECYLVYL